MIIIIVDRPLVKALKIPFKLICKDLEIGKINKD